MLEGGLCGGSIIILAKTDPRIPLNHVGKIEHLNDHGNHKGEGLLGSQRGLSAMLRQLLKNLENICKNSERFC